MDLLLSLLNKEVDKNNFISEEAIKRISLKTGIPVSRIYGVATFYSFFHTKPEGKNEIYVCTSPSCTVNGSLDIVKYLQQKLKVKLNQTTKDKKFSLHETSCIGCCYKAPAMLLNGKPEVNLTKEKIDILLKKCKS